MNLTCTRRSMMTLLLVLLDPFHNSRPQCSHAQPWVGVEVLRPQDRHIYDHSDSYDISCACSADLPDLPSGYTLTVYINNHLALRTHSTQENLKIDALVPGSWHSIGCVLSDPDGLAIGIDNSTFIVRIGSSLGAFGPPKLDTTSIEPEPLEWVQEHDACGAHWSNPRHAPNSTDCFSPTASWNKCRDEPCRCEIEVKFS